MKIWSIKDEIRNEREYYLIVADVQAKAGAAAAD